MKASFTITLFLMSLHGFGLEVPCDISARFRCKNGTVGAIIGRGKTIEVAKVAARQKARQICLRKVDYIRFGHNPRNC